MTVRLSDVCGGRDNNLNLIRMIAASAVLVSHAWPIALGPQASQPMERLLGMTLGGMAVMVFFAISGFLIARSFDRSRDIPDWSSARIMRLFPGLAAATLLTALAMGPLVTTLSPGAYFTAPATWTYALRNTTLVSLQYPLPGVFEGNPYGPSINGSLWTLFHEVVCYMGVLALGLLGALRGGRATLIAVALFAAAYLGAGVLEDAGRLPFRLARLRELSLPFFLGSCAWVWRDRVRLLWPVAAALWVGAFALKGLPGGREILAVALTYCAACAAYLPGGAIRRFNGLGDYSYGIYIYAFPVQQLVVHLFGPMEPAMNIALSLPPTLLLAIVSWRLVEKSALAARGQLADLMRNDDSGRTRA